MTSDQYDQVGLTDTERTWAAVAHIGSFVAAWIALGILCPIIVLIAKGNESRYVRHHAYESLNFQLNALFWIAISVLLIFVLIGIPMIIAVGIWYLIMVIVATLAANRGEWYRYPAIIRFFKP
jgi:uncharacterized Tic20 family protein